MLIKIQHIDSKLGLPHGEWIEIESNDISICEEEAVNLSYWGKNPVYSRRHVLYSNGGDGFMLFHKKDLEKLKK